MNDLNIDLTENDINAVRTFLGKSKFEQNFSKSSLPKVILNLRGSERYNFNEDGLFILSKNILDRLEPWDFPNQFRVEIFPGFNLAKIENDIFCYFLMTEKVDTWNHALGLKSYFMLISRLTKLHNEIEFNQSNINANIYSISMELMVPVNIATISDGLSYGYTMIMNICRKANRILDSFDSQMDAYLEIME